MKYNSKYGRWFTKCGLVYRYDYRQDKLVLCKQNSNNGYKRCIDSKHRLLYVHRAVYETFVGEIPDDFVIDHINTKREDNIVENLRAVTQKENNNNPLTIQHKINKPHSDSEFGKKYFEHFGYSKYDNVNQYTKEIMWYKRHGKCRWEK